MSDECGMIISSLTSALTRSQKFVTLTNHPPSAGEGFLMQSAMVTRTSLVLTAQLTAVLVRVLRGESFAP